MLKRIVFIVFCALFYLVISAIFAEFSEAGDCNTTISEETTTQLNCADNDSLTITSDGSILNADSNTVVSLNGDSNVNINNAGTLEVGNASETDRDIAVDAKDSTDSIITNSGTIRASGDVSVRISGATNLTINNESTGTIATTNRRFSIKADTDCTNCTINNYGTISADSHQYGMYLAGDGLRINNYEGGTISGTNTAIYVHGGSGTTTIYNAGTITSTGESIDIKSGVSAEIILDREPTFTGEIDLNSTATPITLSCGLTTDIDLEIYDKTNMTITDNLCGNDTYEILDSSLAADADNSETNGYIRIYGEDLEIAQNNPKYRSENVLTKLRGLFNAANYIHWEAPEEKFFKIFHSSQKREGIYSGDMSGVVGQLNPFVWGSLRSNVFLGYTRQDGDFDNGEFLGGDNYALGLKNVYENNFFTASFTPMIGMADLKVTDFDTDTKTSITTNLLSEFAGINGKLGREIKLSEEGSLDLNIQSTLGVQRFPEYLAKFSDGDLTVDEAVEQILGVGFEVKYKDELKKGFIIQPYVGFNINNNFNNKIKITADGENKNVSPAHATTSGYYAGVSFTKEKDGLDFDLDLMYGNEDGLINQIAAVSLTKSFGKAKKETVKLEPVPDLPKVDENLTTQDYNKDLNKLEAQNEKLKLLAEKVLQENETSKHLIKELVTEVEKLKLTNQIFKDKILKIENENVELPQTIEEGDQKPKVDKFKLLLFLATIYGLAGGLTLLIISFMNIIRLKILQKVF